MTAFSFKALSIVLNAGLVKAQNHEILSFWPMCNIDAKSKYKLSDKFIKNCHSGRSGAQTLNSSELTGIIEQNYHSKLSEAQARNSNELTDKFEINCHSGRCEAKTRNPGVLF